MTIDKAGPWDAEAFDTLERWDAQWCDAGATRYELLMVLKMASLLSIHVCSLGAPILLEEASNAGVATEGKMQKRRFAIGCAPSGNGTSRGMGFTRSTPRGLKHSLLVALPYIPAASIRSSQSS